jgi:malic enzyme
MANDSEIMALGREGSGLRSSTQSLDFPNQVNNSNGFPAIFRGTLAHAHTITDEMCIAANALADMVMIKVVDYHPNHDR